MEVTFLVFVQGQQYELKLAGTATIRHLRAMALKQHGIINYQDVAKVEMTWETRDDVGRKLDSPTLVTPEMGSLYIDPRPGWGG